MGKFLKWVFIIFIGIPFIVGLVATVFNNSNLERLKTSDPEAYLNVLKDRDDYRWLSEMKELRPKGYQQEIADLEIEAKSMPAADIDENLKAYDLLSKLEPDNDLYSEKVKFYEAKAETLKQESKAKKQELNEERRAEREKKRAEKKWDQLCNHSKGDALTYARELVKVKLKSPRSAKFSGLGSTDIKLYKNCEYVVAGYVDSQNGFGAMIRSNYNVHLKRTKNGWNIKNIKVQ